MKKSGEKFLGRKNKKSEKTVDIGAVIWYSNKAVAKDGANHFLFGTQHIVVLN